MKVKKQWDDTVIEVEQVWLDIAIGLVWEHGITSTEPARILAELANDLRMDKADTYIIIAQREVAEQRKGYLQAIRELRDAAEEANDQEKYTEWAVYAAGRGFLEKRAGSWS